MRARRIAVNTLRVALVAGLMLGPLGLVSGTVRAAYADSIAIQARQLKRSGNYKLRLSAAVTLAKTRDPRALDAMIHALENDSSSTIRRIAVGTLGAGLAGASAALSKRGTRALERAAERDADAKVRRAAKNALAQLGAAREGPQVFIHIGKHHDLSKRAPRDIGARIRQTVEQAMRDHAPTFTLRWPTGKVPTRGELEAAGTTSFYVGATVSKLAIRRKGRIAEVSCTIQIRVNPWFGSDGEERWQERQVASATGSGKVTGAGTRSGLANAKRECVLAVIEQLTGHKVIPFLNRALGETDGAGKRKSRSPKSRSPKSRSPKSRSPKLRSPKPRSPKSRSPKFRSGGKSRSRGRGASQRVGARP